MKNPIILFKDILLRLTIFLLMIGNQAFGQINKSFSTIPISITWNKTTTLIFPTAINNVDRGSRDILVQKPKGLENILQVKAGKMDFPETNLTIVTQDGGIHHFVINYAHHPENMIIEVGKMEPNNLIKAIFNSSSTDIQLAQYSNEILSLGRNVKVVGKSNNKISIALMGIYVQANTVFYHIRLKNSSNIDYDVDFLKFHVRDKRQLKRTSTQELELDPMYVHIDHKAIKAKSTIELVYAFEKFTFPNSRKLIIELYEKNGGRQFELSVNNDKMMKAKPIKEMQLTNL